MIIQEHPTILDYFSIKVHSPFKNSDRVPAHKAATCTPQSFTICFDLLQTSRNFYLLRSGTLAIYLRF